MEAMITILNKTARSHTFLIWWTTICRGLFNPTEYAIILHAILVYNIMLKVTNYHALISIAEFTFANITKTGDYRVLSVLCILHRCLKRFSCYINMHSTIIVYTKDKRCMHDESMENRHICNCDAVRQ